MKLVATFSLVFLMQTALHLVQGRQRPFSTCGTTPENFEGAFKESCLQIVKDAMLCEELYAVFLDAFAGKIPAVVTRRYEFVKVTNVQHF